MSVISKEEVVNPPSMKLKNKDQKNLKGTCYFFIARKKNILWMR